jgi:hypothetical protein
MTPSDLFDEFSRFGDRILHGIGQDERPALKYKYLLGKINELLHATHGMVVKKLEKIEKATKPAEAEAALAELGTHALEESFRMEGLCDVFEAFGRTLDEMAWRSEEQRDSVAPDLGGIHEFSRKLMDREQEVARIYTEEIKAIVNLGNVEGDLPGLRKRTAEAKKALTDQMADFAAKAKRFTSLPR